MNTLLELPLFLEDEEAEKPKFCHIACMCSPKVALCGAYKEKVCFGKPIPAVANDLVCSVCSKQVCKACLDDMQYVCPRCGE